ncbi:MAG: hypothetical protein ACJ77B_07445 [Chloroflexota bacterium]
MVAILGVFLAVAVAQTSDLVTFLAMMSVHGPAAEANPLVGQAFIAFGAPAVVLFKVVLVAFVVATFAIVARRYKRLAALVATLATVVGLIGAYSNILTLS